jgi:hypothetical protein
LLVAANSIGASLSSRGFAEFVLLSAEFIPAGARKTPCCRSANAATWKLSRPIRASQTRAIHPGDLTRFAKVLREAGIVFKGPLPGSRKRPDGSVLHWQTLTLEENPNRLLPFFIEWSAGSIHPSVDSPEGCDLLYFGAASPGADAVRTKFRQISVELSVERGDREELRARFSGRKGEFELTS